ncbi:ISL3 family transposase [Aerococcaceae bacterium 50-4]
MTYSTIIKQLCGISDKIITICNIPDEETLDKLSYIPIMGVLTYKPKACDACGVKNESTENIIKYGFKTTSVRLSDDPAKPINFKLKKQRFKCKHCEGTFIARSSIVHKFDSISILSKNKIAAELTETQFMKLVGQRYHVSSNTVARILLKAANGLDPKGNYLPEHLSIDEFKSVDDVEGAMSAILVDPHNKRLIDIIEDRKQHSLIRYFHRYSREARAAVKTISMDLYSPYLGVDKACFPNAKIVIDRFHIVQLLNNTINSMQIEVMNEVKNSRPTDYRKLKNQWKLMLKNADHLDFSNYYYHRLYHAQTTEQRIY